LRSYKEELHELLHALREYHQAKKKPFVIAPVKTLLFPLPKAELLGAVSLEFGAAIFLFPHPQTL